MARSFDSLGITLPENLLEGADADFRVRIQDAILRAPVPAAALAGLSRLAEVGSAQTLHDLTAAELDDLACIVGASLALTRYLAVCEGDWPTAAAAYRDPNPTASALNSAAAIPSHADPSAISAGLRRMARAEMYRIGARDLLGLATLDETLAAITGLADAAIDIATSSLRAHFERLEGSVVDGDGKPIEFCVLGLGKLGGRDLNYSSDVDVIYLYEHDEVPEGAPSARTFFHRLASEITRAIGETTSEGHVFRVDLRLRPEGDGGPLVNSIDNALTYYEGWGDTWERGVYLKARPVGGDARVGEKFIEGMEPFVFRRHLDYLAIEDFRRMKDRIDAEQSVRLRGGKTRDVKLGRGGIRELEFVVQVLQLIHGGHVPAVRTRGTVAALAALVEHEMIPADEAEELRQSYGFLRNVEHAVQVVEQRQTQRLPADEEGVRALARRLGYGTGRRGAPLEVDEVDAFEADWSRMTKTVHATFVRFLELKPEETDPEVATDERDATELAAMSLIAMLQRGEEKEAAGLLEDIGFSDGARSAASMVRIYRGRVAGPASPQRRRAVESMAPALVEAALASADPEAAVDRLVEFLIRTGAHTSYLALLGGSPTTMDVLVRMFATSPYLAAHLVGHPELLDSLVRSDRPVSGSSREQLTKLLGDELVEAQDEEAVLETLRRFRITETMRTGLNDLSDAVDTETVFRDLTLTADVCLVAAADCARILVEERRPGCCNGVDLAIVALGKMGGREMTYASDLDLLFVYRSARDGFDGAAHDAVTRWIQKTISLLQTQTRDGIVYKIDARLRPSGRSGPLVASMDRFVEYHKTEAELWERQAHVRARVVYGSETLRAEIENVTEAFVYGQSLDLSGVAEIDDLRMRVENELADESSKRKNIKTGRGGIVDIEFVVQMLLLRYGVDHPQVRKQSTAEAIEALAAAELIPKADAQVLSEHYLFLRRLEARLRLERDRPVEGLGTDARVIAPLAKRLGFGGEDPGAELLTRYAVVREEVRGLYERYFRSDTH